MIIQTMNEAEKFVKDHPNFSWDGWDIVYLIQDDYAEYLSVGVYNKEENKWYKKSRYPYDNGWNIPDPVIR